LRIACARLSFAEDRLDAAPGAVTGRRQPRGRRGAGREFALVPDDLAREVRRQPGQGAPADLDVERCALSHANGGDGGRGEHGEHP
jgi:hypothetical protein